MWEKRPMAEARRTVRKPPITVRWVDVNKADDESCKIPMETWLVAFSMPI